MARTKIGWHGKEYTVPEPRPEHYRAAQELIDQGFHQSSRKYRSVRRCPTPADWPGDDRELDPDTFEAFRQLADIRAEKRHRQYRAQQDQRTRDRCAAIEFYANSDVPEHVIEAFADGCAHVRRLLGS